MRQYAGLTPLQVHDLADRCLQPANRESCFENRSGAKGLFFQPFQLFDPILYGVQPLCQKAKLDLNAVAI